MTNAEFNIEFDILYNNIASNKAPGLNTYEKSVYLTKAQKEILNNHFNAKGNKYYEGYDDSIKRQIDFSNITVVGTCPSAGGSGYNKVDPRSILFEAPANLLYPLNEVILDSTFHKKYNVIPISYTEYLRLTSKPFAWPLKSQAWRLINKTESKIIYEVILKKENTSNLSYTIRYIRKPKPIILENLTGVYSGLTIDNETNASSCELDSELHEEILQRAVELAKIGWSQSTDATIQAGQRSE